MPGNVLSLFPELERDLYALRTTGTLPSQAIHSLIECSAISAEVPITTGQIQPASIDLRLGAVAYRVPASFLPTKHISVQKRLQQFKPEAHDLTRPTVLERGALYLIPLIELLALPGNVWAKANPKSTSGRLDVFVRVLTEFNTEFDRVPTAYRGHLYAEVMPRSFSIVVHQGTRLCQLRFIRGKPHASEASLLRLHEEETLAYTPDENAIDPLLSSGLRITANTRCVEGSDVVALRAIACETPIDLDNIGYYPAERYWEPIRANADSNVILRPDECYLLLSKERIRVPPAWAAELVPFDPVLGEFRVHYAGFFDPGFGYGDGNIKGTPAVLELRSHGLPFLVQDGQAIGRFVFEPLISVPDKLYGTTIGSSYQNQGLSPGKQFKAFSAERTLQPSNVECAV